MNDSFHEAVAIEYDRYISDPSSDPPIKPLTTACARLMRSGLTTRADIGPCLAVFWHHGFDFDGTWRMRIIAWLGVHWMKLIYWRAPMWNDFEMARWCLSRDPRYIGSLYEHLKKGSPAQKGTGEWMIRSVCSADAEFAEHWGDLETERGPIFNGNLLGWISGARCNSR